MVHRDGVVKQLVKPVGVPVLSLAQITVHRLGSVGQSEAALCGVVVVHQVVHTTELTAARSTVRTYEREETVVVHFLIDTHLLLRVHDVEVAVAGLQAVGIFTGIADLAGTLLTTLGGDDNHTGHSAGTVDRSCRTVLQNLETLDVVGVETGNGT